MLEAMQDIADIASASQTGWGILELQPRCAAEPGCQPNRIIPLQGAAAFLILLNRIKAIVSP
jgi:hypothetical protein